MASTMLSAASKKQYSSMLSSSRHCLPVFDEICGTAVNFVFLIIESISTIRRIVFYSDC